MSLEPRTAKPHAILKVEREIRSTVKIAQPSHDHAWVAEYSRDDTLRCQLVKITGEQPRSLAETLSYKLIPSTAAKGRLSSLAIYMPRIQAHPRQHVSSNRTGTLVSIVSGKLKFAIT